MTPPRCLLGQIVAGFRNLLFLWAAASGTPSFAEISENELKAAFLFNFALFTKPGYTATGATTTLIPEQSPVVPYHICIHGRDALKSAAKILTTRLIDGRVITVRNTTSPEELGLCQLVFIGAMVAPGALRAVVHTVAGLPVITVSDAGDFPTAGIVFNLVKVDQKIAFQINTVAARAQKIDVSAKLTRLAKDIH